MAFTSIASRRYARSSRRAFSLIELLVCVAIIAVLAALMLPALGMVKQYAQHVQCASHVRQLVLGSLGYSNDHAGRLPPYSADMSYYYRNGVHYLNATANTLAANKIPHAYGDFTFLGCLWADYLDHPGAFFCPKAGNASRHWLPSQWGNKTSYIFRYLQRDAAYVYKATMLSAKGGSTVLINEPTALPWSRHNGERAMDFGIERHVGASFAYADGHVLVLYPGMPGYGRSISPFY